MVHVLHLTLYTRTHMHAVAAVSGENDVEESRSLLLGCNPFELWREYKHGNLLVQLTML